MTFQKIAHARFSCRKYKEVEVSEEIITELLETIRIAPSAVNRQPWHFIMVKSPAVRELVLQAYPREWFKSAPMYLVACGDHSVSWKRADGKDHLDIDLTIAIDHLVYQAASMGLATCWVCNFNAEVLAKNLNLPINVEPIAIIPIGYPDEHPDLTRFDTQRKKTSEFLHNEGW